MRPIDALFSILTSINSANGIRTRVWALRGPRPSPLDDSAATPTARSNSGKTFDQFHRPGGNRTPNRRFWRPVLYQLSYGPKPVATPTRGTVKAATLSSNRLQGWLTGIEPATPGATDRCSNQLSYSHHETALQFNRVRQSNQLAYFRAFIA